MGIHKRSRQHVYRASTKDCNVCSKKTECTRDRARSLSVHIHEDSIQKARVFNKTKEYRISQRVRKRIEELFGEAKEYMGLRRAKFRGLKFVKEQVLITAAAQNIKRLVKHISKQRPNKEAKAMRSSLQPLIQRLLSEIFAFIFCSIRKSSFQTAGTR